VPQFRPLPSPSPRPFLARREVPRLIAIPDRLLFRRASLLIGGPKPAKVSQISRGADYTKAPHSAARFDETRSTLAGRVFITGSAFRGVR
jgi:hypothetical protein